MFRHIHQGGIITLFNSASMNPLQLWSTSTAAGEHIIFKQDEEVDSIVLCIQSADLAHSFISCPKHKTETLGITLPFITMLIKNMDHLFGFEAEILDTHGKVRRFRSSNYESEARVEHKISCLPLRLDRGWNYLTLDLRDMATRIYGTGFKEVRRITVHASICVRLILFADRIVPEDELPKELRLYSKHTD
ncbi:hypothetical protein LPJ58_004073 [Coemansia sp. RSA 1591]|nr:hypothetical protein LPJ58_004073 [Coemansia sp. RSA 1591]KAJ1758573.1 hypothetical protein LPJ69_004032 [Coemansia sp. RSA 1752]